MLKVNPDWNPGLYLKFRNERTRPSIDLVSRIDMPDPHEIIDIGCGPGNSTEILSERWPDCRITGIDNSAAMIEQARSDYPSINWEIADASKLDAVKKYDIVFSNAALQWIPDHDTLLCRLVSMLNANGLLAVQVPLYHEMPVSGIIDKKFEELLPGTGFNLDSIFTFHSAAYYYGILSALSTNVEIWETSYFHVMKSCHEILEMVKSTGLKPYLEKINDDRIRNNFETSIMKELEKAYPEQPGGYVLFPFKRLFFIAVK